MRKHFLTFLVVVAAVLAFDSCASFRNRNRAVPPTQPETPPIVPAEKPSAIMGKGQTSAGTLSAFLLKHNPELGKDFTDGFALVYIEEAAAEGVNADVAFAQMCVETGFLSFRGQVTPDMNNFAGLGTTGPGQNGARFSTPRIGVRAQVQHLKAYATTAPLNGELVDPRYQWVKYGSAPSIADLSGRWAADKGYGDKIKSMLERIYAFSAALNAAAANSAKDNNADTAPDSLVMLKF